MKLGFPWILFILFAADLVQVDKCMYEPQSSEPPDQVSGHSSCLFIIYAEQQQHPLPLPLTANRILYIINVGEYDFSYKVNSGNRVRCVSVELCYQFSGILFFSKMAGQFKL